MKKNFIVLLVLLMCSFFVNSAEWIGFSENNNSEIEKIYSVERDNTILLNFKLPGISFEDIKINDVIYKKLSLENTGLYLQKNEPELLTVNTFLALPADCSVEYKIIDFKIQEFKNIKILP